MKGGWEFSDIEKLEKLTNLSNKYITSVFDYYNERPEWDFDHLKELRLRLLSQSPYMDPIEVNKENLKLYLGEILPAGAQEEISTPKSIFYVAEINKLFAEWWRGVEQRHNRTLRTDEVRGIVDRIYNSAAGGGGLKNKRKTKRR